MIKICDAVMGSGKTQSAISFMNEHPDRKFIYITPTLSETERIVRACPALHFRMPSDKLAQYNHRKVEHTAALIREGRNVSSTHSGFKLYTEEIIEDIRRQGYTLIIDEAVSMLSEVKAALGDVQLFIDAGYLSKTKYGTYRYTGKEYHGSALSALYKTIQHNDVFLLEDCSISDKPAVDDEVDPNECLETDVCDQDYIEYNVGESIDTDEDGMISSMSKVFYWELPLHALSAFSEVYVLTYRFEGESMHSYIANSGMSYEYIGVRRSADGEYHFSDSMEYYPSYLGHLSDMVRIWENEKLNLIGRDKHALSKAWFNKRSDDTDLLRRHMGTYFKYHFRDKPATQRMWTTFKDYRAKLRGAGYSGGFLPCNMRSSNDYRDRTVLAYCVNLFMNPFVRRYLTVDGKMPSNDEFALSMMLQWIWRSAIRDGKPIDIYVPSKRMRTLLQNWIVETQTEYHARMEGGEQCA